MTRDTGESIEGHIHEPMVKKLIIDGVSMYEISRRTGFGRHAIAAYRNRYYPVMMSTAANINLDAELIEERIQELVKDVEDVTKHFKEAINKLEKDDAGQHIINNTALVFLKAADVQERKYRTLLELGGQLIAKQLQLKLTQVNIYDSPQWVEVSIILDEELEPDHHDLRKRIGERLLALQTSAFSQEIEA